MTKAILAVVDDYLKTDDVPEVGIHLARLQKEGHSIVTAKAMIGAVLVSNLFLAQRKGEGVDYTHVRMELARLPKLSSAAAVHAIDIRGIDE